ncbi:MAG: type I methionyl aminopeptidase [bacterium]|nr:type I methionyl aminopeptidase [bacterium]
MLVMCGMKLKTPQEIELMREGGHILAEILDVLVASVKVGIQTKELDSMARELISAHGAKPSFLNYNGFPATLCVSVNEEIVHGLPSERKLKDGDLVKLDLGILYKGFHTDSARSVIVGSTQRLQIQKLIDVTAEALRVGIKTAQPGKTLGDVGHAIHEYVKSQGFDVVRDLIGHGIGAEVHEEPEVPNYGKPGQGPILKPGMVIAIEPMVVMGGHRIANGPDGYAYITADKKLSAHIEHTIAITENGPEILTK